MIICWYTTLWPYSRWGVYFYPQAEGQTNELFYMWINFNHRYPVEILDWYEYEKYIMIFCRKMVDTKSSKLTTENGKNQDKE